MAFCIPKPLVQKFTSAIKSGELDVEKLRKSSSEERRNKFAEIFGEDLAKEVNTSFESKLLLKDQKAAMISWARSVAGIPEPTRNNLVKQISNLGRVLDARSQRAFLEDLAEQKLGAKVTLDEANEIFQLSQDAVAARARAKMLGLTDEERLVAQIEYGEAYQKLADKMDELKGTLKFDPRNPQDYWTAIVNVAGIPKQLMSTFDFSAPLVQNIGMISTKQFWTGLPEMFRYFADESHYRKLHSEILGHPDYDLAVKAKLGLTDLDHKLFLREEQIQSNLLENMEKYLGQKIGDATGVNVPRPLRAFNRAFTGYLNYTRFKVFTDLVNSARLMGEDVRLGSKVVEDLASVVNTFSGRANLPKGADQSQFWMNALSSTFWAPRKAFSVIQMFNPVYYAKLSPVARNQALKQLAGLVLFSGSMMMLARAMGADVDMDPRSQDFAKIKLPNGTRLDITGGSSTYLRLWGRLLTGQMKLRNATEQFPDAVVDVGERLGGSPVSRAGMIYDWTRGKFNPSFAIIADALHGEDAIGNPFDVSSAEDWKDQISESLVPLNISNMVDLAKTDPDFANVSASLAGIFGLGVQFPMTDSKYGIDVWGNPVGALETDDESKELNRVMAELSYTPRVPPRTITSVKLTEDQHKEYITLSGLFSKQLISPVIQSPMWNQTTDVQKLQFLKDSLRDARKIAADIVSAKSIGTDNDIPAQAAERKNQQEMFKSGLENE